MSPKSRTLIIAEAGVNHNGDIKLAKLLVDAAANAGANLVKFQTFNAELLATELLRKRSIKLRLPTRLNPKLKCSVI